MEVPKELPARTRSARQSVKRRSPRGPLEDDEYGNAQLAAAALQEGEFPFEVCNFSQGGFFSLFCIVEIDRRKVDEPAVAGRESDVEKRQKVPPGPVRPRGPDAHRGSSS